MAYLVDIKLQGAKLQRANFQGAELIEAHLCGSILLEANLIGATLWGAHLQGANLQGVDLRKAKNITIEQLSKVKTLYKAKLDPEIEEQIREKCPHLLEEPKDNGKDGQSIDPNS